MLPALRYQWIWMLTLALYQCQHDTTPPPSREITNTQPSTPVPGEVPDTVYIWNNKTFQPEPAGMILPSSAARKQAAIMPENAAVVKLTWAVMQDIRLLKNYYEQAGTEMLAPVFSDTLRRLEGRIVEVEGYVVPVDEEGRYVALSATPYASCFFCGKGSPASVMTVNFSTPDTRFDVDDHHRFRGRLRLNYDQIDEFYYVLDNSQLQR